MRFSTIIARVLYTLVLSISLSGAGFSQQVQQATHTTDTCAHEITAVERGLFSSIPLTMGFEASLRFLQALSGFNQKIEMLASPEGYRTFRFIAQQAWFDSIPLLDDKSMIAVSFTIDSTNQKHLHHVEAKYCFMQPKDGAAGFADILKSLNELNLPFVYRTNAAKQKYRQYALGCNHTLTLLYSMDMNNQYSIIDLRFDSDNP